MAKAPVTAKNYPLISEEIGTGSQNLNFERIFKIGENKLRISIKSDSYDFQSYARIEIYNPNDYKWNVLHSIHYSKMQTASKLYYKHHRNGTIPVSEFQKDIDTLIKVAEQILA